ncbi:IclR family transcriptional regulator [Parafrigoribacterium mesophilum]|uniref:IclR family transcriptional regulator n=1 Tax=Parafrigoribacterium mesophilum TaxID=433646 RepID=UPI0031FBAF83
MAKTPGSGSAPILLLRKITEILNCFSLESPDPTLQEITRQTRLPASTCQRLVQNMVREGYLDRDRDRYRIGLRLVQWSMPGTFALDIVSLTKPILQELRDQTEESACLYVRDGAFRTVVGVAETRHVIMRPFRVGQVLPIHAGAPGKIFLAFDPDAREALLGTDLTVFTPSTPTSMEQLDAQSAVAREQGFYAAFGERNIDVGSISGPVFGHTGDLVAVLGIGFPTQRVGPDDVERLGPAVSAAARAASVALGHPSGLEPAATEEKKS